MKTVPSIISQPSLSLSRLFPKPRKVDRTIKCLIIDDEQIARDIVKTYIVKLPYLQIVGECRDAVEALTIMQRETVDLLILDIQMPNLSGIELLKSFSQKPLTIFTTAYPQYALEGFNLDVVDYLLKPFRFERFLQAINKVSERLRIQRQPNVPLTTEMAEHPSQQGHLLVRADHKVYKVTFDDIAYLQSMKEYVAFHLHSGGKILALMALRQLEQELPASKFMRIHRSYIIPIKNVTATNSQFVHLGKIKLPIGGNYRKAVRELLLI